MLRFQLRRFALVALFPTVTACGSSLKAQGPVVTPAPQAAVRQAAVQPIAPTPAAPPEDPVLTLIAASDRAFKAGQKELEQGHVEAAKLEFNRSKCSRMRGSVRAP